MGARRHHYGIKIHHLSSLRDAPLRSALWQSDIPTFIFPPFEASYPEISKLGRTDLRAYVASGHNLLFIGSYESQQVINDIFGLQLEGEYKYGPYYRNDRNTKNTPFQYLPERLSERGCCWSENPEFAHDCKVHV